MARFPVLIDLQGNNCIVVGGGRYACTAVRTLLDFGAKVTVVSPTLCEELQQLDREDCIRHIPRKYFRGDCVNAYIAVAATNVKSVNIAVAEECKARRIPVNVAEPAAYGTFVMPSTVTCGDILLSVQSDAPDGEERTQKLCVKLKKSLSKMIEKL